ncbi:UbiA-like protein EboC [Flavicella sediminum]|uniref:UbiA-like protein EboC n=1 Tax=Flavicella sediminum TaxID=2585141 RepID=UPI001120F1E9|nr:UbiA-like protein EboC [Flavicella sediminum]
MSTYKVRWFAKLQLMRPANIVTSVADIIAGIAIAGFLNQDVFNNDQWFSILLLIISTCGLYGGGIVFNDVFDFEQDKINRPERVIPSGRLTLRQAKILGMQLFSVGVFAAFLVSILSGILSIVVMLLALLYDKYSKHHKLLGPINMGMCRGGNLILGMSISSELSMNYWLIGVLPVLFISAITLTAQKEVKGKNKLAIAFAIVLDLCVVAGFLVMHHYFNLSLINAIGFLILWFGMNFYAKLKAIFSNKPENIMKAVKMGILSLIPLNATYVAGFSSVKFAVLLLLLLPISMFLAKKFPVT